MPLETKYEKEALYMVDREQIGIRIAALRKKAGLSQTALAERLGVSAQAVSKWESGDSLR